jgi:5'-phosphate synthase pdxT subunit
LSQPVIGVLALQGDVREHVRALESVGATAVPFRRERELAELDGVVVPGGESTTIHKLAVAFELFEPLRDRLRAGLPAYGSCAGMILLANDVVDGTADQDTFGGLDVVVRRNAFGRQVDSFESEVDFSHVDGGPMHAVFIRAPWVEATGDGVEVLARVPAADRGEGIGHAADGRIVGVRQGHLLATSFHPELTGDTRVHGLFVEMVKERS